MKNQNKSTSQAIYNEALTKEQNERLDREAQDAKEIMDQDEKDSDVFDQNQIQEEQEYNETERELEAMGMEGEQNTLVVGM